MPRQDVAVCLADLSDRLEDAKADVADIGHAERAGRGGGNSLGGDFNQHSARRGLPVPGAEHEGGVDDDSAQSEGALLEDDLLGLALGNDVGDFRDAREGGHFGGGVIQGTQPEGVDAGDMDHFGASFAGGDSDLASPLDVDLNVLVHFRPAHVDMAGGMQDDIDSVAGGGEVRIAGEVAPVELDGEPGKGAGVGGLPCSARGQHAPV